MENVHQHISASCKDTMHHIHQRRYKKEGKFQRLCNTGQHGGQRGRQKKSCHCLFLFRFGCPVHSKSCSRQSEDHQRELTGHKPGCRYGKLLYRRICQLGKEDILGAFHHLSSHFQGSAHACLPERQVKYMMKSKGDQGTFQKSVYPGSRIAGA